MSPLLVAIAALAFQGSNLGKTDAQILAMGRQKWFAYYSSKEGDSTADNCDAESLYGAVLKRRNDRLAAKRPKATREAVRKLRPELTAFAEGVYEVGEALTGGGTLWNVIRAGISPNVEEALGAFVGVRMPASKATAAGIRRELDDLLKSVRAQSKFIEQMAGSGGGVDSATKGIMQARLALAAIEKVLQGRPAVEARAAYGACGHAIDIVRREAPGD